MINLGPHSKSCATKKILFWHEIIFKNFACGFKFDLYNADIRSKRERKREKDE